jgi:hypothetical protein
VHRVGVHNAIPPKSLLIKHLSIALIRNTTSSLHATIQVFWSLGEIEKKKSMVPHKLDAIATFRAFPSEIQLPDVNKHCAATRAILYLVAASPGEQFYVRIM